MGLAIWLELKCVVRYLHALGAHGMGGRCPGALECCHILATPHTKDQTPQMVLLEAQPQHTIPDSISLVI